MTTPINPADGSEVLNFEKKEDELIDKDKVLCNYCGRTHANRIRCLGMCVADNEY